MAILPKRSPRAAKSLVDILKLIGYIYSNMEFAISMICRSALEPIIEPKVVSNELKDGNQEKRQFCSNR